MPTLIPELARSTAESNRRAAASVDVEAGRAERVGGSASELDTHRRRVARQARVATRHIMAEVAWIGDLWASAVEWLQDGASADEQAALLREFTELAGTCRDYIQSVRRLWEAVERMGGVAEAGELADAGRRVEQVHAEASRALAARQTPWRPADPARLERGRREIEEGFAVSPDAARARFRSGRG